MRTSLSDIQQTEQYLNGELSAADACVFEARLLTDPSLTSNMNLLKRVYRLLSLFHRKKVKQDVVAAEQRLFTSDEHTDFRNNILSLFNK